MADVPFEVLEHTADVAIQAFGRDLAEVFVNAARGMFHFMISAEQVRAAQTREVMVEADDLEGLLVAWLNHLLVVLNADGFLPAAFEVDEVTTNRLRARLHGEPVDPARHRFHLDVKAATYHDLRVARSNGWAAYVLFDV